MENLSVKRLMVQTERLKDNEAKESERERERN